VNSVLTSMLSHAMGAGLLPVGVLEAIDKRHRAFFWTGEETCNGGQCKVAWTDVCVPKKVGRSWGAFALCSKLCTSRQVSHQTAFLKLCSLGLLVSALVRMVSHPRYGGQPLP
jgi:hypothetical protein